MKHHLIKLSDVAKQVRGVSYPKAAASDEAGAGRVPLLRGGNVQGGQLNFDDLVYVPADMVSDSQWLKPNDIVVVASSGSIDVVGKAAQLRQKFHGTFGAFCKVMRPSANIDAGYLGHFFQTVEYRRHVSNAAAGININNLRAEHLDEIELRYPPLDEQRRIAAILDQADDLRRKRREALGKLDGIAQSLMKELVESTGSKFVTTTLGHIVEEFRYGTSEKSTSIGRPVLRIPNVVGGEINLYDLKFVELSNADYNRLALKHGDLLFVRTNGNPAYVGRCAAVTDSFCHDSSFSVGDFVYASYLIRGRIKATKADPVFLQAYLSNKIARAALLERAKTSAGQFNINIEGLSEIPVRLPSRDLQRAFAARVAEIDKLKAHHRAHLARLDALFASLQHRAFRGDLPAPSFSRAREKVASP